jgi:hypothetical protein
MIRGRAVLTLALLFCAPSALAQEATTADQRARAQQLFERALADAERGDYAAACPRFRASQEADPKTSTLLNLGACYEKNHQLASAWGAFKEASARASTAGRTDFAKMADERVAALEPKLAHLTILVTADAPNLAITRDGTQVSSGERGLPIPVDAGEHEVAATADGRVPWSSKVTIVDGQDAKVSVPGLAEAPKPPPTTTTPPPTNPNVETPPPSPPPELPPPAPYWTTWRIVGASGAGVGIAALATGTVMAVIAKSNYSSAYSRCQDKNTAACPPDAVSDAHSARGLANAATPVFISGAVLAGAGAALFFLAPTLDGTSAQVRVAPAYANGPRLVVEGAFF